MRSQKIILSGLLLLFSFASFSQSNFTLDRDFSLPYQPYLNSKDCTISTDALPYDQRELKALQKQDSIKGYKDLLFKKDGPLIGKDSGFGLTLLPLLGATAGYD